MDVPLPEKMPYKDRANLTLPRKTIESLNVFRADDETWFSFFQRLILLVRYDADELDVHDGKVYDKTTGEQLKNVPKYAI